MFSCVQVSFIERNEKNIVLQRKMSVVATTYALSKQNKKEFLMEKG